MSENKDIAVGSDGKPQEHLDKEAEHGCLTENEVQSHNTTAHSKNATAQDNEKTGEQSFEAQNEAWSRDLPIRDADHIEPAGSLQRIERFLSGPAAGLTVAHMASMSNEDRTRFKRWYYEQSLRDEAEKGALEGGIAAFLDESKSDHVPEHIMDQFRAEARAVREQPLPSFAKAFLDELRY